MTEKSPYKSLIRSVTGGAAVLTLLLLVIVETVHPEISMTAENKLLLVGVISALLAVDISFQRSSLPIAFEATEDGLKISWRNDSTEDELDDGDNS